jgi:hypothetical protein
MINLMRYKIHAPFWFKEFKTVVQIMEENDFHNWAFEKEKPGLNGIGMLYFHCALSCISLVRANKKNRKKYKNIAKRFSKKINGWVNKGNPNCQHYDALVEAELNSLSGKEILARKNYEVAILLAGRWGMSNDQALAHERCVENCLRNGDENGAAAYHFNRALQCFREWGAEALVDLLQASLAGSMPQEINIRDREASSFQLGD